MSKRKFIKQNSILHKEINNVGIFVEALLIVSLIYSSIITIFASEFRLLTQVIMSLTLMTMGYNNYKLYKNEKTTAIYIVVGILVLISLMF